MERHTVRPREEAVVQLPPEFYDKCTAATARFLHTHGISEEKLAKFGVQTIGPLTGTPPEHQFRLKNFANSDPGSNQGVPDANLGEQAKISPEQRPKQTSGLLQEILMHMTASVKMIFHHISVTALPPYATKDYHQYHPFTLADKTMRKIGEFMTKTTFLAVGNVNPTLPRRGRDSPDSPDKLPEKSPFKAVKTEMASDGQKRLDNPNSVSTTTKGGV